MDTYRGFYVFQELHLQQLILRTPQGDNLVRSSFLLSLKKGLQAWKQVVIVICSRLNSTLIGTEGQELLRFWVSVLHSCHKNGRTRVIWEINIHNYFVCVLAHSVPRSESHTLKSHRKTSKKYWCNFQDGNPSLSFIIFSAMTNRNLSCFNKVKNS